MYVLHTATWMGVLTTNLNDIGQDYMYVWVGERQHSADKAQPPPLSLPLSAGQG